MRIAFILNNLDIGGPQKGTLGILDSMDPEHSAVVVSLAPGGELRSFFERRCEVIDVPPEVHALTIPRKSVLNAISALCRAGHPSSAAMLVRGLALAAFGRPMNIVRQRLWRASAGWVPVIEDTFDVAIAVSSGLATYFAIDCLEARQRYHWVIGDYGLTPVDKRIDGEYFARTNGGMAVCQSCADGFESEFPDERGRLNIAPFPVAYRFYEELEAEPVELRNVGSDVRVLTVGRLVAGKGLELAIGAAKRLAERGAQFQWFILGDGPQRELLSRQLLAAGLGDRVHLIGYRLNTLAYLKESDIFVHPSRSEGRSIAVEEALFTGVPTVVTRYATVSDQVRDGVTGTICDLTSDAIADAVWELLSPVAREQARRRMASHVNVDLDLSVLLSESANGSA